MPVTVPAEPGVSYCPRNRDGKKLVYFQMRKHTVTANDRVSLEARRFARSHIGMASSQKRSENTSHASFVAPCSIFAAHFPAELHDVEVGPSEIFDVRETVKTFRQKGFIHEVVFCE